MNWRTIFCCGFVLAGLAGTIWGAVAQESGSEAPVWQAFEWEELAGKLKESGHVWLPFLKVPTLDVGAYILPVGGKDQQSPHERDEVYYIVRGEAVLQVEGEDQPVKPGSIVFVAAKAKHHFHSITDELQVLVFFSSAEPKTPG